MDYWHIDILATCVRLKDSPGSCSFGFSFPKVSQQGAGSHCDQLCCLASVVKPFKTYKTGRYQENHPKSVLTHTYQYIWPLVGFSFEQLGQATESLDVLVSVA